MPGLAVSHQSQLRFEFRQMLVEISPCGPELACLISVRQRADECRYTDGNQLRSGHSLATMNGCQCSPLHPRPNKLDDTLSFVISVSSSFVIIGSSDFPYHLGRRFEGVALIPAF